MHAPAIAFTDSGALLRVALKLDAVVTGANGVAYLAAAGLLDGPLGVSAAVLRPIGAFLVVFAAAVWVVATRETPRPLAVRAVIEANLLWVLASLAALAAGVLDPSALGAVWTALQACVVAAFAAAQWVGLRRAEG